MHRPCSLELLPHGSSTPRKHIRSPRVLPSPRPQQKYLMKFISRNILHGTNKSKLVIHALRRRLLRRGLNSPRTPRTSFPLNACDHWETTEPEPTGNSPILLPQLPRLCLGMESPDSGYFSDESRSSPSSPRSDTNYTNTRPTRRYILPDLTSFAGSPSDLVSSSEIRIRLSGQPVSPRIPPVRSEADEL
ncbi:hypothetical protein DFH09DRAFT_1222881 [Mycena vulgaris]|nr:hypothetical protein DFH09DRAFT_1222881 [Mycena vulgaris]